MRLIICCFRLPHEGVVYYGYAPMIMGLGHIRRAAEKLKTTTFFAKRFERKVAAALAKDEQEVTRAFQKLSQGRLSHHAYNLFTSDKLCTAERVRLFEACAHSNASKDVLAHGFQKMMERSTPHERNDIIYPRLLGQVQKLRGTPHVMTSVMMRGWISSCSVITDSNHRMAQEVLELPPSARG